MNIDKQFESKYLAAADVPDDADLVLTISHVVVENLGQGEKAEAKPVIYFSDNKKGMACNKTNATTIKSLYGAETDAWTGKQLAIFATEVDYQGKQTLALRVRMKAPKAATANGHTDPHLYTLEQAVTALENVGLTKQDLGRALPKDTDGKARYNPERDSPTVNKLVGDAIAAGISEPL